MTTQTKEIVDPSPHAVAKKVAELATQGWQLEDEPPMGLYGWLYVATMTFEGEPPAEKLTRAEILAKARAAKANKASETE